MAGFILDNLATIIVFAIVAAIVVAIVVKMAKDKQNGKSACGCKCSGCPNSSACHSGSADLQQRKMQ